MSIILKSNNMKFRKNLTLSIYIIFLFTIFDSSVWAQNIEIKDGIKYLHNDKYLWGSESKIRLDHVRTIGSIYEKNDKYILYEIYDVNIDKEGNIYIVDMGNRRIQKYNSKGKYKTTIGRAGQGPGEFILPCGIAINASDKIYLINGFMILSLNKLGKELDRFLLKSRFTDNLLLLESEKLIVGSGFTAGPGIPDPELHNLFSVFSIDGTQIGNFGKPIIFQTLNSKGRKGYIADGRISFEKDTNDNIYITYFTKNCIEKRSSDGNIVFQSDRKINFEETEYRMRNGRRVNPNIISTCLGIDSKNRIWVSTVTKQPDKWERMEPVRKENAKFEIFNSEGVLLGELPLPQDIFRFRIFGDRLFIIDYDRVSVSEYKIIELE